MVVQELAQRAVLEALEGKIEALRGSDKLQDVVIELEFWNDLSEKFPEVFRRATAEDVLTALLKVVETNGHFKLETIKHSIKYLPNDWSVPVVYKPGSYLTDEDILLSWHVRYSKKPSPIKAISNKKHVFWLTSENLIYKPTNDVVIAFSKKDSVAYKLLQFFANNPGKTLRKEIPKEITTPENVSEEVAKLRAGVERTIGLSGKEFIDSQPGYGLADNVQIEEK